MKPLLVWCPRKTLKNECHSREGGSPDQSRLDSRPHLHGDRLYAGMTDRCHAYDLKKYFKQYFWDTTLADTGQEAVFFINSLGLFRKDKIQELLCALRVRGLA